MDRGYIRLFRKFFEHEFWQEKRTFSRTEAWIDLIESARWGEKPCQRIDKRGSYTLNFGDVFISETYLSQRYRWSRNKVRAFLQYLQKRDMIRYVPKTGCRTIINIIKLRTYLEWESSKKTTKGTGEGQVKDRLRTGERQVKVHKKEPVKPLEPDKPDKYSPNSNEVRISELLLSLIRERNEKHKQPNIQTWAIHIDRLHRINERSFEDIEKAIRWCQVDSFWQNNILSTEKLREKYDQLFLRMNEKSQGKKIREENQKALDEFKGGGL